MGSVKSSKQADLKSISLAGLLAGNDDVVNDLVSACKENGFFYLDFRHESTRDILKLVDDLAAIGKSVFKLPLEEKEQYSTEKYLPSRLFGYKRVGCSVGPFAGKKDGYESFSIHNNGIFGEDTINSPRAIDEHLSLFETFMSEVHQYTDCILSNLSKALELPYDLKDCHRKDKPSSANMAMLQYLAWGSSHDQIGNMAHTDMGTLTVVFSQSDGLQAMLPGDREWSFIPPRAGHAVVNVGDSLRFLSNGVLASSLHRVVPPPDAKGQDKFSVIYFLRPEFDAKFTTHDGKQMNSVEWHNQKYALFREASLDAKQHGAMLTGRNEYLGSTDQ
ncbi:Oxoglutarate/iron-dependent oxygenase [Metarhizium guizhouense ARSEF 977]|uniref:Oxoglutarate/iron-dependent oxygenase n=1 Tax=Metarhizium guizhouense (strain ARSEF 977) TaxID=1276136 RepID=A0A0B4I3X4_METGA|nr:Oxoglutarate/iron-dependent oxygenase [Metarhizium guizhouense ARSEF 977]